MRLVNVGWCAVFKRNRLEMVSGRGIQTSHCVVLVRVNSPISIVELSVLANIVFVCFAPLILLFVRRAASRLKFLRDARPIVE